MMAKKKTKKKVVKTKVKKVVAKSVKKRKVGRPKRVFTADQKKKMGEYALAGCQNNTIAGLMDVPLNTITDNFREFLWKKRCERKLELREQQNKSAKNGVPSMQIWLGKNDLDQADKSDIKHSGAVALLPPVIT